MSELKILNPQWRLDNLYKIKNKDKETVLFRFNSVQKKLNRQLESLKKKNKPLRAVVLKYRQAGVTTFFCIKNLDTCHFNKNQFCKIIAHRANPSYAIFHEIIKFAYDNIPDNFRRKAFNDSRYQLAWRKIGSQILVSSEGHGTTPNLFHVTETSRIKRAKDIINEAMQGVPRSGEAVQESTANGKEGYFYDLWCESTQNPEGIWYPIFLQWWDCSDYRLPTPPGFELDEEEEKLYKDYQPKGLTLENLVWRREKITELGGGKVDIETGLSGKLLFQQSYPFYPDEAFVISQGSIFDLVALYTNLVQAEKIEPKIKKWGEGYLRVFEKKKNVEYLISVDPSYGEANSFSAVTVFEKATRKIVATLHGKYDIYRLTKYLKNLGTFYHDALIAIERNTGHAVINELLNHENYFNLYFHNEYHGNETVSKPGFPTNAVTRNLVISTLENGISIRDLFIPDIHYIRECLNFGFSKNNKIKALTGNDDRVMSLAIGYYLCLQITKKNVEIHIKKPAGS